MLEKMIDHHDVSAVVKKIHSIYTNPNIQILELGCGDGINIRALLDLGFQNIRALDRDKQIVRKLQQEFQTFNGVRIDCQNATDFSPRENYFDVIFHSLFGIFLKPEQREDLVRKIYTSLKPQGHYLFEEIVREKSDTGAKGNTYPYTMAEIDGLSSVFAHVQKKQAYRMVKGAKVGGGIVFVGSKD